MNIHPRAGIEAETSNGNFTSFIINDKNQLWLIQDPQWGSEAIHLGSASEVRITYIIRNLCALRKHMRKKETIL